MPAPYLIIQAAWIAFCAYWIWAARTQKREQKREPPFARLLHVAYMACGFVLLYAEDPRLGVLNRRFLPEWGWIAMLGAGLTAAGVAFAIWARRHIGKNWSAQVTIRKEHELIRSALTRESAIRSIPDFYWPWPEHQSRSASIARLLALQ